MSKIATEIAVTSIGTVYNEITEPIDDIWDQVVSRIDLDGSRLDADALDGLSEFSHVEIVYIFHLVEPEQISKGSRHPRGKEDWPKVGIFAQRAKNRLNRIGVTVCRLLTVEGLSLSVSGLDAVDGTPVVDIKPYIREFAARGETRQPRWATELMTGYWNATETRASSANSPSTPQPGCSPPEKLPPADEHG